MLRYPARNYVHYLFSKRAKKIDELIAHLDDLHMPLPQNEQELVQFAKRLVGVRKQMLVPSGFDPLAPVMNSQTVDFLSKWQITDIWRRDHFVGLAIDFLSEPLIRRMIEALLLGPLSPSTIAERVRNRFGFTESAMNVRVIRAYSHYFWNMSAMNQAEWRALIAHWLPQENNSDYLAALGAPRSPGGAAFTLAFVDRSAESLNPAVQYAAFRDHGFTMFMEHALLSTRPSLQRTQGAFMAFNMVKMSDEELTKHRGASSDLLEEFRKIQTLYDQGKITSVKQLPTLSAPQLQPVIDVVGEEVQPPTPVEPEPPEEKAFEDDKEIG